MNRKEVIKILEELRDKESDIAFSERCDYRLVKT